jgi:hypothetical protein
MLLSYIIDHFTPCKRIIMLLNYICLVSLPA